MNKLTSQIIAEFKKTEQTQMTYSIFHSGISKFDRMMSDEAISPELKIELEMIANTHIPKIFASFLNLTPEQKTSNAIIRNGKTNFQLFQEQILLISERISQIYDLNIENRQRDFLIMHRKTQTIQSGQVNESNMVMQKETEEESAFQKEAITLFKQFDGSWETGFNVQFKDETVEQKQKGMSPQLFTIIFVGALTVLGIVAFVFS